MSSQNKTPKKINKSFLVVGMKEIQKYNLSPGIEEPQLSFIQNVGIFITNLQAKKDHLELKNEKWIRILNNSNSWIRYQYETSYINPITDLQIHECELYGDNYLLLPIKLYDEGYRPIRILYYKFKSKNFNLSSIPNIIPEERSFKRTENSLNVLIPINYNCKNILGLPTKKSGVLILINRRTILLPIKQIIFQKLPEEKSYKFCILRHNSPYSYKYFPEIIDTYPPNENKNPSIALFCFPDGIQIKENFETPKCFNFVLTDELGERTYGAVLILSQEIDIRLSESFIPNYSPENKTFYIQKAICVLSNYPFYYNSLLFLREIYNITEPQSAGIIPIERAVCTFVDSLYLQSHDKLLRFNINKTNIDYYRIPNYGKIWDTNDKYLETLFRVLSYENIITAWEGLLLEKKLYIICSSKNVLSQIANALINLLFPFKWIHVYIPILPQQLKIFIDSPVPLIIGICFHIEINELPQDSLILNINKSCFENYKEKLPPLPPKLSKVLMGKLSKLKEQYKLDNPINVDNWISNQEEAIIYLGPDILLFPKIDTCEIRDAFYSFFLAMFKNYEKYLSYKNNITEVENIFLKENFLRDNNSLEPNSFLSLFCETALFSQFVDSFSVEENNINSSFAFFIESIKKGKGKNKYFLSKIIPKNIVFAPQIEISDLKGKKFNYPEFPNLDTNLFLSYEAPKMPYKSKFLYSKDEWCYSPEKLKKKEWPKYFLYLIYDIWFTFFSFVLNIYEDNQSIIMMDYALFLVEYLSDYLKISPSRNLFSKIIKSCARNALNPFVKQLLNIVKNVNKSKSRFNSLFHNEYLNGLYFLTENVNTEIIRDSITNSTMFKNTMRSSVVREMKKTDNNIENRLKNIIFMTYNLCENCLNKMGVVKCVSFDEILAGFVMKNKDEINSICSNCLNFFEPKIYYIERNQENLDLKEIKFLSPMKLVELIDNIIKEKGEISFYRENEWSDVYWNIVFYFQLFDLPTCVLYVQNNMDKFEKLKNILKENKKRKLAKEKEKKQKINFFQKFNIGNKIKETESLSNISTDNTNISKINTSDLSFMSVGKQGFFSSTENDIWTRYQLKKQYGKKILKNISNEKSKEDKNEVISKIVETRNFLKDIMIYFCQSSQEKLKIFLEKYDKMEKEKKNNYINMVLKKENDKYIENNLNQDDKFSVNTNLNMKINILQKQKIENKQKNLINKPENEINSIKKEKAPMDNLSHKRNYTNTNDYNNLERQNIKMNNNNQMINNTNYNMNNNLNQVNINNNKINNQINPNNNNYIYNKTKTYNNWNFNERYQIPKTNYNDPILKTPDRNLNINPKFPNVQNLQKHKNYTIKQIKTYKSIYDDEQNV